MKKLLKILTLVLVLSLSLSIATACNKDEGNDPGDKSLTVADIAATYELDGSNWGMNLKWYITINANSTFNIKTEQGTLKNEGTVACNNNTFMLIYSDSTPDSVKQATFTFENDVLHFTDAVPIGTSRIASNDDHPDPVFATKYNAQSSEEGKFTSGAFTALTSDGVTVTLTLNENKSYTIASTALNDSGTFTVSNNTLSCTGTSTFDITSSGRILSASLKIGTKTEALTFYHSTIQGYFTAKDQETEGDSVATLELTQNNFTITAGTTGNPNFTEETGTFTLNANFIYLAFEGGETTLTGVVSENDIAIENIPISNDETTSLSFKHSTKPSPSYDEITEDLAGEYNGTYTKMSMGTPTEYTLSYEINTDNTYKYTCSFEMSMGGESGTYYYGEEGSVYLLGSTLIFKASKKVTDMETGELSAIDEDKQVEYNGTIGDASITISLLLSPMSQSRVDAEFTKTL